MELSHFPWKISWNVYNQIFVRVTVRFPMKDVSENVKVSAKDVSRPFNLKKKTKILQTL